MVTDLPPTRASLAEDLTALGLRAGETVIVHSSLRAVGWVPGGRVAVVQSLLEVLGPAGTLVVPAQTMDNSDPRTGNARRCRSRGGRSSVSRCRHSIPR